MLSSRRRITHRLKGFLLLVLALLVMLPSTSRAAQSEPLVSATVDIIVAIDTTGSMSGWIQQVRSETAWFANQLQAEGFDYRLGLLDFKDISVDGGPWWYGFTNSASTFSSRVGGLSATGGGDWPESDINALLTAQQKFVSEGRSTAGRMVILITDAPFKEPESGYNVTSIATLLNNYNIVVNIIGSGADAYGQASSLNARTRGEYYNTTDLRTAYQGIISQIQRNTPPQVTDSRIVLPPGVDPGSITTSTELEFTLAGSDPDGDVLRYYWEALSPSEREIFLGDTPTIRVRLTEPGVWEVTGTVTDPTGESVSVTHRIAVGNRKPTVSNLRIHSPNTKTPTLFWDYADPDGHAQGKVHIRVKQGAAVVWDSGEVAQSGASAVLQGMAYGQNYTVDVQAMDQYDAWSDWTSLSVHINQLPDLRPFAMTTVPSGSVLDQAPVVAKVQVKNEGEQPAGSFNVSLYDESRLIGQQTLAGLSPGASTEVSFSFQAAGPGNHTLKAVVDSGGQIAEASETNNEITGTVQVLHRVDLTPSLSIFPDTVPQGGNLTVRVGVTNGGQGAAGAFRVDVLQNGTAIAQKTIERLEPGATTTFDIPNLPAQPAGTNTYQVVADAADQIPEAREDNNTVQKSIQVVAPQEVTGLEWTATPDGRSITVTWTGPADVFFDHVEMTFAPTGGTGTPIRVDKGIRTRTFSGLTPETSYTLRIRTINTAGYASAGLTQVMVTPRDIVPPDEVAEVGITSGYEGRSVEVRWQDPGDEDLRFVELRLLRPDGTPLGEPIRVDSGVEHTTFLHTSPGTEMIVQLQTIDESGNRSAGVRQAFRTAADTIPPAAVRDLAVHADKASGTIRVTWNEPEDEGLETIHLYLRNADEKDAEWLEAGNIPAGVKQAEFRPEANHRYSVRVIAADDQGNLSPFAEANVTLLPAKPLKPDPVRFSKWGSSQVIQWEEAGNVLPVTYKLYRQMPGEEAKEIASLPAGTTRYVDSISLEVGLPVKYYVTAVDRDGTESDRSGPVGPAGSFSDNPIVRILHASTDEVRLESSTVKGARTYRLERRESGDWQEIQQSSATTEETLIWTDRGVQPGHRYQYRVIAESEGRQAASVPISVAVPALAPMPPVNVHAERNDDWQVVVSWQPPADGADAYNLYRQTDSGPVLLLASRITPETRFTDQTVRPDHSYTYFVSAWKNGKESEKAASLPVRVTASAPAGWGPPDADPKDYVGDFVFVEQLGESVRVSWRAAEGAPAHYFVYRQEAGTLYQKLIAVLTGDRLQWVDSTPRLGKTYTYAVQAQYRFTYGSTLTPKFEAAPITVQPPDGIDPAAVFDPEHVRATVDDDRSVLLTWDVPKAAKEYLIYRKESGQAISTLMGRVDGTNGTLFSDTSVKPGSTYVYEVIARYPGGNSAMVKSNAVTIP